jgi:hypothetical protein
MLEHPETRRSNMSDENITAEVEESKEAYWRRVLQEWKASGLKGREFQRRNNLSEQAFVYWKLKLIGRTEKKPTLVPVKVGSLAGQTVRGEGIRIRVGEFFTVEPAEGFDARELREVLAVVRECAE